MDGPILKPWKPWIPPADAPQTKVRCLGPGPEHYFHVKNPRHHRICSDCRAKQDHFAKMAFAAHS